MASLSRGAQWLLELERLAPERVAGAAFIGPLFPYTPSHWSVLLRDVPNSVRKHMPFRWWGHLNPEQLAGALPRVRGVVHLALLLGGALDQGHRGRDRMGARDRPRDADGDGRAGQIHTDRRHPARPGAGPGLPGAGRSTATATRSRRRATAARWPGSSEGKLETVPGAGHFPHARKPVQVNLALRDFSEDAFGRERTPRDPTVHRPDGRPRALYISSPIGLGHAQRDVAIARELRRLQPDLQIDWLAQDPVTRVLEGEGERIHPASAHLANESRHIESESAEHDLHCFQALRRMDEILAANFMLFHDVVRDERYDLWIGDEAWELDYYLHENPREKRVPVRLADRLRRLPADGRRRRAGEPT